MVTLCYWILWDPQRAVEMQNWERGVRMACSVQREAGQSALVEVLELCLRARVACATGRI